MTKRWLIANQKPFSRSKHFLFQRRSIAHYTSFRSLVGSARLFNQEKRGGKFISYLVCHMEKYHKTDIAPVEQENERDETYQANNPQIDPARTSGNYHLIKRQRSYTQFISDKIEALDLPTKVRKDAVLMCSFVVGSDGAFFKNLSPQEQEKFFAECTRFFAERYGEGNIISAIVHTDETTPHLHLNLIPIAGGRLCAKNLFDRKALTALQTDLHREVGAKWNLQRGKEGSQAKHLDTAEYKAKKIVEQARGQASDIIAEADHNAERKVKIAQIHADGMAISREQTKTARRSSTKRRQRSSGVSFRCGWKECPPTALRGLSRTKASQTPRCTEQRKTAARSTVRFPFGGAIRR